MSGDQWRLKNLNSALHDTIRILRYCDVFQ